MIPQALREQSEKHEQLRQQFESCRAVVARARARAVRAAEEAVALRTLSRIRSTAARSTTDREVWTTATRAISEMARERDQILGTVSHEMRQALSAALAAEPILADRRSDTVSAKAAGVLHRQLLHLSQLVELLLDYSRLTVSVAAVLKERVDLRDIVRETVEACESDAQHADIRLATTLGTHAQMVDGDPTRLRQLVSNLVHNALRYTPAGGQVQCSIANVERALHIVVSDTGKGIAAADLERIFEPFTRISPESEGLGIGLAISRRIAQLHGGFITARSDGPGCGTTFVVMLPAAGSTD
ncbi:MAG TPA: HAMP domain-containing sensor histidine kinase [Vicinamibacterales bacterium]|nr:HAMP domain-containing sensor histidine kinase [Vicinamibacterales bacterium]